MFFGTVRHSLDDKGRLALPARFRYQLDGGAMIARGADRCFVIYPGPEWSELTQGIRYTPQASGAQRDFMRAVFGNSKELELDAQGRFLLPQKDREWAGIERTAVLAGMNNVIEVFSEAAWDTLQVGLDPGRLGELAARAHMAAEVPA
ncbi:MAG TPA: division/cell wall cluster transcriptional repressor MraZ [Verrucomicrobiae bacterium]|nr:division/cell wall cluster transcriptional repressor MraZ [Verrucomicrobiae bacterium]